MERAGQIKELYGQGLSDRQIAERLGLSPATVAMYRRMLGLPTARERKRKELMERVRELHAQGLSDFQIASRLGICYETVRTYRRLLGIGRQSPRVGWIEEKIRELFLQGMTDPEIAWQVGVSLYTVRTYRVRMGLRRKRTNIPPAAVRRAIVEIAEIAPRLLKAVKKLSAKERSFGRPPKELAYWNELAHRLAVLALHLPELGRKMGYGLDGLPELAEKHRRRFLEVRTRSSGPASAWG